MSLNTSVSAKHTSVVENERASDNARIVSIKLHELEVFRFTKGEATVRLLRSVDTLSRVNQALAGLGFAERVEKFEDGNAVRVVRRVADSNELVVLTCDSYPDWDSTRTWVELTFKPTKLP